MVVVAVVVAVVVIIVLVPVVLVVAAASVELPDWACAMTSLFINIGLIALCCMTEGFSKPYA